MVTVGEIVIVSSLGALIVLFNLGLGNEENHRTSFEFIYVLILGLIAFAFHVLYKLTKLSQKGKDIEKKISETEKRLSSLNNKHSLELKNISDYQKRDIQKVGYIEGEDAIIERLEITKELTKNTFFGMWCLDYSDSLEEYFNKDTEFQGNRRVRLFNVKVLIDSNPNAEKQIIHHLLANKEALKRGTYEVYATRFSNFEVVIFSGIEGRPDTAFQVFNRPNDKKAAFAIHSHEEHFVAAMRATFEKYRKKGYRLECVGPNSFEICVQKWINDHRMETPLVETTAIINDSQTVRNSTSARASGISQA